MSEPELTADIPPGRIANESLLDFQETLGTPLDGDQVIPNLTPIQGVPVLSLTQGTTFRNLLRLRVAVVLSLAAVIWGTILVLGATGIDPLYSREVIGFGGLTILAISVTVWTIGAILVWGRLHWSIGWLRGFEFAILVPHAGMLIMTRIFQFTASDVEGAHRGNDLTSCCADTAVCSTSSNWLISASSSTQRQELGRAT